MPSEKRVWRDERCNLAQHAASESPPQHGQPSALIIIQPEHLGVTHGPIIAASMPDIYAFFAKHSKH